MKTYSGGCHCGKVRYEVDADITSAMSCNCSICQKTGTLLTFVPMAQSRLQSGDDVLRDYQFNRHVIHHHFCSQCGVRSFARGVGRDGGEMAAINVRCLDDVDLSQLEVKHFDGKSM